MSILNINYGDATASFEIETGTNLLNVLKNQGFYINNPCGGKGTCGKCRVKVKGETSEIQEKETQLLGKKVIEEGYRLACYVKIETNLDIIIEDKKADALIMTEGKTEEIGLNPIVSKKYVEIEEANIDNQKSDLMRLKEHTVINESLNLNLIKKLSKLMHNNKTKATLVCHKDNLIDIEPEDTRDSSYGISVDIGTTTIAAYLVNLNSGGIEGVFSCLNPQKAYGDDVITRINYTMENESGLRELNNSITECLNKAVACLAEDRGIKKEDIYSMVLTGNTTMLHLAMGLECHRLALSPFIPVTTSLHEIRADDLSINLNPNATVSVLPGVSAYVGADTICAILACNMHKSDKTCLVVDIGTNGEMALGNSKRIYSCSVAAGPAFEGAQLRNGMGGVNGAINKVFLTNCINYTTIGEGEPVGICGSGIVDAIAQLLDKGLIDNTGRLLNIDELSGDLKQQFGDRFVSIDGIRAFLLYNNKDNNQNIYITQKDIREIQNAKSAIAAGIHILAKEADLSFADIDKVYLAGGFGSYIDIDSAVKIGLLPKELMGKITSVGNAAGIGAVKALLSIESYKSLSHIKNIVDYIELSGNSDFNDLYIQKMILE